jgi:hypothetical protein
MDSATGNRSSFFGCLSLSLKFRLHYIDQKSYMFLFLLNRLLQRVEVGADVFYLVLVVLHSLGDCLGDISRDQVCDFDSLPFL